ncbi:hypothetical protein Y032_0009g468 [Ancylostoma ceylanicum]|uniref:Uncharacterized protein n=1 Tax=Ancylostoma ceylanicum TaxID=53326 RepID=A0A016VHB6_9BILA|nr:hypothetical protein Y032_0009g468 [Ancylostoma ceylanicum]
MYSNPSGGNSGDDKKVTTPLEFFKRGKATQARHGCERSSWSQVLFHGNKCERSFLPDHTTFIVSMQTKPRELKEFLKRSLIVWCQEGVLSTDVVPLREQ